jgi:hypothetical protein
LAVKSFRVVPPASIARAQHLAHGGEQACRTRRPDAIARRARVDAGEEQRLARVDVAAPTTSSPESSAAFTGRAARSQGGMESALVERRVEGFGAEAREELARRVDAERGRPHHRPEAPRVGQAQASAVVTSRK